MTGGAGAASAEALDAALLALALSIVADGEGSTRTMKLTVTGAQDDGRAEAVARAVGQLAARQDGVLRPATPTGAASCRPSARRSGADGHGHLPARIAYEDIVVVERRRAGRRWARPSRAGWPRIMRQPEIDLHRGAQRPGRRSVTVYFSDLTHDYVSTLNAEYST